MLLDGEATDGLAPLDAVPELEAPAPEEGAPAAEVQDEPFYSGNVPPELQEQYRQMQAAFTTARQKDRSEVERLKAIEGQIPELKQASQALQKLVTDRQYRAQVFGAADAGNPQAQSEVPQWSNPYKADVNTLAAPERDLVKHLSTEAVMEQFYPVFKQIVDRQSALERQLAMADANAVMRERPEMKGKSQEVASFLSQNPTFFADRPYGERFQRAYRAISDDAPAQPAPTPNTPNNGTRNTGAERRAAQGARPAMPAGNAAPVNGKRTMKEIMSALMARDGITPPSGW
jgi:chaperonin cofactor prefoldin